MQLRIRGATDRGLVRSSNQDSLFFSEDYGIAIVSDGMGGHKGGEIASALSVDGLKDAFLSSSHILIEHVGSFLDEVLRTINSEILRRAAADKNLSGMGATINYLQFAGGKVAIGHAGDSRTYLARICRNEQNEPYCAFWQITIDHNVGTFVDRGLLKIGSGKMPLSERQRARLMRGMGVAGDLKADLYLRSMEEGDVYLTCSDGLHGYVSEADIVRVLCAGPLDDAPDRLIRLAHSVGAPDNVTVVISSWSEGNEPLLNCEATTSGNAQFLVRMPAGNILGPLDVEKIVRRWLAGEIPFDAEICSSGKPWVFLNRCKELFERYPELGTPEVRSYVSRMLPTSLVGQSNSGESTRRRGRGWSRKKTALWIAGVVCVALSLVLATRVVLQYIALQNTAY